MSNANTNLQYYGMPITQQTSNTIEEVANEVLIDLLSRQDLVDYSSIVDQFLPELPSNCSNNFNNTCIDNSMIILDESYIHQLIDLELRNVPSSLGLVWSKLSSPTNEFNAAKSISSTSNTTPSTSPSSSFSPTSENHSPTFNFHHQYSPSTGSLVILPSLDISQQPDWQSNVPMMMMMDTTGSAQYPSKITKKHKMKGTTQMMNKQSVSQSSLSKDSFCISFHQPESSFSNFTSYNADDMNKKVSKKRKSSTGLPNYRVRFSHNKFEEIEFKKSNPKGKFIIFK